jgi:hypothetical protein
MTMTSRVMGMTRRLLVGNLGPTSWAHQTTLVHYVHQDELVQTYAAQGVQVADDQARKEAREEKRGATRLTETMNGKGSST